MSPRRFPRLTVLKARGIDDLSGMFPLTGFRIDQLCDDDLVPGTKTSVLLKDACCDLFREATHIAKLALDATDVYREGPVFSVLPRLNGDDFQMVTAWKNVDGLAFVASSIPLPHLAQADGEYAGYDSAGRAVYFGKFADLPA